MRSPSLSRVRRRGSALLVVLPLIILLSLLMTAWLVFSRQQRTDAGKQSRQQSAAAAVENRLGGVVSAGRGLMESAGELSYTGLSAAAQESSAELTNGYQLTSVGVSALTDGITNGSLRPWATAAYPALANDASTVLTSTDDLFRGARAYSQPISLDIEATRNNALLTLGDEGQGQVAGAVRWQATMSMRAIPLSQFTCFTGANATLDANVFSSGLGRSYVGGDAALTNGAMNATYRFVVAGNVNTDGNSSVSATAVPADSTRSVLNVSSTDPTYRDTMRPTDTEGGIVTGGEVPGSVAIPATVAQMTVPPSTDLGDRNIYRLSTQAARVVHLTRFDPTNGGTFVVTDASGAVVSNPGPWRAALDARNTQGGPAITFAYAEHYGAGALQPSYYVYSDVAGAMLIVRQTRILTAPLSVATPLPIAVINGFDDLAPGAAVNDPAVHLALPRHANSLISSAGIGQFSIWQE